jgi:hypothetical protein
MAITGQALGDGQLAAGEAVIYTVPAATTTYVKSIVFTNTGAGQNVLVLLARYDGVNSRRLAKVALETDEQFYYDEALTLEATDEIRGHATNANEVDYILNGGEEA